MTDLLSIAQMVKQGYNILLREYLLDNYDRKLTELIFYLPWPQSVPLSNEYICSDSYTCNAFGHYV